MSSVIAPDSRAKCRDCGNTKFVSKVFDRSLNLVIKVCVSCGGYPDKFRIRRMLPLGIDGKSIRADIRHNRLGERISSIDEAMHIARSIDYDLRDGRFDPNEYRSGMDINFHYQNIIDQKYIPYLNAKYGENNWPNKKVYINHLKRFFGKMDIRQIKGHDIKEFQLTYKCGERSKDLTIQELGFELQFFKDLGIISVMPEIPKTRQSREREASDFLNESEQVAVLNLIEDEIYRKAINLLFIYAVRPGDLRALKWRGVDFKNETITFSEHFAKSILKPGRKSTSSALVLPMTNKAREILSSLPRSINEDDFVFKGRNIKGEFIDSPLGEKILNTHWMKACKLAKKKKLIRKIVPLYIGTKSSTLSSYVNDEGVSKEELLAVTGHTSIKTLARYAKESEQTKLNKAKKILEKKSGKLQ